MLSQHIGRAMLGLQKLGKQSTASRTVLFIVYGAISLFLFLLHFFIFSIDLLSYRSYSFTPLVLPYSLHFLSSLTDAVYIYILLYLFHFPHLIPLVVLLTLFSSSHLSISNPSLLSLFSSLTGPETVEVRYLMKQLARRIAESDRTRLTSTAIADSLFGLQGESHSRGHLSISLTCSAL